MLDSQVTILAISQQLSSDWQQGMSQLSNCTSAKAGELTSSSMMIIDVILFSIASNTHINLKSFKLPKNLFLRLN